jgi:hydrogenase maturation factor
MGELLSRTARRIALGVLGQQPGFLDRLLGHEVDIVRYGKEIQSLGELTQKREYQKVLATVRKLPERLQNQKFVLVHKLAAASQVDEAEYARTIAQWEKLFPRDPSLPLVSIDGYVLRKEYDMAIKVLETLNSSIGGDPYLLVLAAGQYNLKGTKPRRAQSPSRL